MQFRFLGRNETRHLVSYILREGFDHKRRECPLILTFSPKGAKEGGKTNVETMKAD